MMMRGKKPDLEIEEVALVCNASTAICDIEHFHERHASILPPPD